MKKRDFIKTCFCGLGGIAAGSSAHALSSTQNATIDKWSREGMFAIETPRGVKCMICPNECTLKPREISDCRNRMNHNGKLYTMAYGNPCAVHVDPIEKKPLYHFLPSSKSFSIATAGCNLACLNCQNWTISQKSPRETRNVDLMPEKVVKQAISNNCKSIAYTYSEPITFYEYTFDTSMLAREEGVKNVLVSAGYINELPLRKLAKVIDAANIDLKSFSNEIYLKLNAGTLDPILNTLKVLKEEGVWLEMTNLIVPGWTDDMDMIKRMCNWLVENNLANSPLHFSRFHPMYKLAQLPPTPTSTLNKARDIAVSEGLHHVYVGNVPGENHEDTYCSNCDKKIIERKGFKILENHIHNGACKFCKNDVSGVW